VPQHEARSIRPLLDAVKARALLPAAALVVGCMHITHPARVLPGDAVDIAVGRAHLDYDSMNRPDRDPDPGADFTLAQLHLRRGWVLPNGKGFQIELVGQKRWRQYEPHTRGVTHSTFAMWADVYGQLAAGQLDLGVGAVLGAEPEIYAMAGKQFFLAGSWALDLAAGMRFGAFPAFAFDSSQGLAMRIQPFANLALTVGRLRVGAFVDAFVLGGPFKLCDDACFSSSYVSGQIAGGAFTGWTW
jgi:hypothetical protein